jgi:hypothetical protein
LPQGLKAKSLTKNHNNTLRTKNVKRRSNNNQDASVYYHLKSEVVHTLVNKTASQSIQHASLQTNKPSRAAAHELFVTSAEDLSPKTEYIPWDSSTWPWEFTYEPSNQPYLVVCHRISDWIYPISRHFKILRIIDGEVPPWNSTALLLHEDTFCENHTYVKEAVRRRGLARYLDTDDLMNGWNNGVFWPEALQSTQVLRSIQNRPALVRIRGEVFWRNKGDSCSDVDFIVDRQTERLFDDCFTIHFIQGMSSAYLREHAEEKDDGGLGVDQTFDLYTNKVMHPKANPAVPFPYRYE